MADGPLFIVDNSDGGRNGLDYLREWSELASSVGIATGYFEIGPLLDLDGHWQKFDKIRILMGDEISHRTKKALLIAVKRRAEERLNQSIEDDKERDPFLTGVDAIVDALSSGQIECRVYNKDKFHAKTYITHGRFDLIGSPIRDRHQIRPYAEALPTMLVGRLPAGSRFELNLDVGTPNGMTTTSSRARRRDVGSAGEPSVSA